MKACLLATGLFWVFGFKVLSQPSPPFVYFRQDFCNPDFTFESGTPNSGQVDHVITSSTAHVVRGDCHLDAVRTDGTGGGSVRILRTTPLMAGQSSQTLHFRVRLDVKDITQSGNLAAYFGIGDQLPVNTTFISNSVLFSKLAMDFNDDGTYNFRVGTGSSLRLSQSFTGPVTITWVLNNGAETLAYFNPEEQNPVLEPGKYDVWLNEDKWLSGMSRLSDVALNNFAFILSNGVGSVRLFDIEVSKDGFQLPLLLNRFKADRVLQSTQLHWEMVDGHTASYFSVERSNDGVGFEGIGGVQVVEGKQSVNRYDFTDFSPVTGQNYYRLKMVGYDGEVKYSPIEVVHFDPLQPTIMLAPNPCDPGRITLLASGVTPEKLVLMSMAGTKLAFDFEYDQAAMKLDIYPARTLPAGVYLLRLQQGLSLKTVKVVIP